jgi:hypothetical protein
MSIWSSFKDVINKEYDRRIRAASNIREYNVGGHGHGHGEAHEDHHLPEEQEAHSHAAFGTDVHGADVERPATLPIGH